MVRFWRRLATVCAWLAGCFIDLESACAARARRVERRQQPVQDPAETFDLPLQRPIPASRVVPLEPEQRARSWRPGHENTKTARDLRLVTSNRVQPEPTTHS